MVNPDPEARSSRRVHNEALYCSARPDLCIRNHNWNQYGVLAMFGLT